MRRTVIITAAIILVLLAVPFVLGLCSFRLDSFYEVRSGTEAAHGPLVVSFRAIKCPNNGQKYSIPGALAPNEKANGFQVTWELKGDIKRKLSVDSIKAVLLDGGGAKPLDVPFEYWAGEFNAAKNVHYAFVSTEGYDVELPLGVYHVRLSYTADGVSWSDDVILDYVVVRKFGFHSLFYSRYFE